MEEGVRVVTLSVRLFAQTEIAQGPAISSIHKTSTNSLPTRVRMLSPLAIKMMSERAAKPHAMHCVAIKEGRVPDPAVKSSKRPTEVEESALISLDPGLDGN